MSESNDGGGDGMGGGVAPRPETALALAAAQLEAGRRARANVDAAYDEAVRSRSAMAAGNEAGSGAGGNGETSAGSSGNPFSSVTLQRGPGRSGPGWTVPRARVRGSSRGR